nr:hypothetical protein [uncultured Sphingomonas sp.]
MAEVLTVSMKSTADTWACGGRKYCGQSGAVKRRTLDLSRDQRRSLLDSDRNGRGNRSPSSEVFDAGGLVSVRL